jgi:hypothetical protein
VIFLCYEHAAWYLLFLSLFGFTSQQYTSNTKIFCFFKFLAGPAGPKTEVGETAKRRIKTSRRYRNNHHSGSAQTLVQIDIKTLVQVRASYFTRIYHLPAAKTTLTRQLNCAKRAHQQIVYYFSSPNKPQEYELVPSKYISPIADIHDIKTLKCNSDHVQQAEIFRAQHMAYHARTMQCKSLPEMDMEDECKQATAEQLLSQNPGAQALPLPALGPFSCVIYQIPTVEHIIATRQITDTQQLPHLEYLVKWVGKTLADNSWVTISDLGYNASFLIQNFNATRAGQQVWKTFLVTAYRRTIVIVFEKRDTLGIRFAITGDQADRRKRFVYSINDDSPAMILSSNILQVGAVLVSVNGDSSYNSNQIGTICKIRPLTLEFCQPAYPSFYGPLQVIIAEDNDIQTVFTPEVILEARQRIFSPHGNLFSPIIRHIITVQKSADQSTGYISDMDSPMDDLTSIDNSTDLMANGIYLASLGSSLVHWLVGLDCKSCLSLFNHHGVFTLAQLFCRDISHRGLAMVRGGQFGQNMSELQQLNLVQLGVPKYYAVTFYNIKYPRCNFFMCRVSRVSI